jgi:hypothetical protein
MISFNRFYDELAVDAGKALLCPLNDESFHTYHWTKASMGVSSGTFLKEGKPPFSESLTSQIRRLKLMLPNM